jgi:hypothetical protein
MKAESVDYGEQLAPHVGHVATLSHVHGNGDYEYVLTGKIVLVVDRRRKLSGELIQTSVWYDNDIGDPDVAVMWENGDTLTITYDDNPSSTAGH